MPDGPAAPVRVGLLGAGAVAQAAHLPAYRRLRNVRLTAICDNDPPKLRALRARTGVPHAVATLDEMLALDDVDAVDVCLPTDLHADAVRRCLAAGKHVLCEKPLALSAAEVAGIVEARDRAGKVVLVGMNNRYRDDAIRMKRFVEEGALGDVAYARAGWFLPLDRIEPGAWRYAAERAGGGVFMDLGVHLLDLVLWLCGYPAADRVSARFFHHEPRIGVEDSAIVHVRCGDGPTITLETSWSFLSDESEREPFVHLYGASGTARLERRFRVLQRAAPGGGAVDATPRPERAMGNPFMESYEREIAFFGEVAAGRAKAPPLSEQLALARLVEAVKRAAETGREVEVEGA